MASQLPKLHTYGANVLVICPGSQNDVARFAEQLDNPFPLLTDDNRGAAAAFGLRRIFFGVTWQSGTFVIDEQGVVRYVHRVSNPSRAYDEQGLFLALDLM